MFPDAFTRKFHPEIALLMDMVNSIRKLKESYHGKKPVLLICEGEIMPCGKKRPKPPKK